MAFHAGCTSLDACVFFFTLMAEIKIENMTKRFGDFYAVKDLNLDIADGEFLILLGPSGCGKTTTLRSIAGLERQSSGDIFIGRAR